MTLTPEESINRMEAATKQFYMLAVASDCYTFIEFAGLLEKYCNICRENLARGIDFRELNGFRAQRMELQPHEIDYFNEKLNFIFQGLLEVKGNSGND